MKSVRRHFVTFYSVRRHFVTFYSPGTLFAEDTSKPIPSWDTELAVAMSKKVERYGAKPYAFRFETELQLDKVKDDEGNEFQPAGKQVAKSGLHFIQGKLETYDDVKESILRGNMRGNGWPIVCVTTNSYRSVNPFDVGDVVVDAKGRIVERGDDPKWVAYRKKAAKEWKAQRPW